MKPLFVGSLPFRWGETELRALVAPFGPIGAVEVHTDWVGATHEPYAVLEVTDVAGAIASLDGMKIGPVHLRVHERSSSDAFRR